jgi:hypothetical protein
VFIVGPRERISRALELHGERLGLNKEIRVIGQAETMLENAHRAFNATLPAEAREGSPGFEKAQARHEEKAVLVLSSDIPMVTAGELDEFIERSDLSRYDYVLGMTREDILQPYYPQPGRPGSGIHFAYFCFRDSRERQNNLHMIRVLRVFNRDLIQTMYQFRYQQRWHNILRLGWRILRRPEVTVQVLLKFILLHVSRMLDRRGGRLLEKIQVFFRRFLIKEDMQRDLSRILKARFGTVVTSFGGAALDVDNEKDFQIIKRRYHDWMDHQERLIKNRKALENPEAVRESA